MLKQNEFEAQVDGLKEMIPRMSVGDRVILTGVVYTARDAAHKKIFQLLDGNEPLPFDLRGSVIYYASPTPVPAGYDIAVGACGPTTSGRLDAFTPRLLELGVTAMIGKGERSDAVTRAIARNQAIYLCAVGGAGALISKHIRSAEEIAFPELGCESVRRMQIEKMPLTVAVDSTGRSIFKEGPEAYVKADPRV